MPTRLLLVLGLMLLTHPIHAGSAPGPGYKMKNEPSGKKYDFHRHGKPERPWLHPYHKMCVTKFCLLGKDGVVYDFEQALDIIQKFDNITKDLPKLIYLVVFPDHIYPSWTELDPRFKRKGDKTPWDSLRWLMKRAREKHNTLLSLHINMLDAYPTSPLWETYMKHDIIHKQKDGKPSVGTIWGGHQSTPLSYYQEWKLGYAQKRIDDLLKALPDLQKHSKTVHIDAFQCWENRHARQPSPFLGHSQERECETVRKIFRYWRDKGIDATAEGFTQKRDEDFAGLQAWCWLQYRKGPDAHIWDMYPPHIYGTASINLAHTLRLAKWDVNRGFERLSENLHNIAINYQRAVDLEKGVKTTYPFPRPPYRKAKKPTFKTIPDPLVLPLGWREDNAVMIRFEGKCPKDWPMPESWKKIKNADVFAITTEGEKREKNVKLKNGKITFIGKAKRPYLVVPK